MLTLLYPPVLKESYFYHNDTTNESESWYQPRTSIRLVHEKYDGGNSYRGYG